MKKTCLLLFAFLFAIEMSSQCTVMPTNLKQRTTESDLIIEGKIINSNSFFGDEINMIFTKYEIEVFRIFKGEVNTSTVEMISTGGIVGDRMLIATPSFEGKLGEVGIFMIKKQPSAGIINGQKYINKGVAANASIINYSPDRSHAADIFEGKFNNLDALYQRISGLTKKNELVKEMDHLQQNKNVMPGVTNISPLSVSAGTETLITITGTQFGASQGTVFFPNADNGGANYIGSQSHHVQSWSDNQITVWVPEGAGSGSIIVQDAGGTNSSTSGQMLTINYNINNIGSSFERTYLIDESCDSDGGYKFLYSVSTANNGVNFTTEASGDAMASFERARSSWQTDVGYSFFSGVDCGTTMIQIPGDDGTNLISFDSDHNGGAGWDLDVRSGNSTLGVAYSSFGACGSSNWEVNDLDIVFRRDGNPNGTGGSVTWEYGPANPSAGESDFESVALHEIGHTHQLGHVILSGAVMHYSITTGTFNRTLGTEDINGANDVETASVNYNPPLINCGSGNDYNCNRDYVVYNPANDCAIPGALPVELNIFEAKLDRENARLSWQTSSEINNEFFTLEYSTDGNNFDFLAEIEGSGNSDVPKDYRYIHHNPIFGKNYYRLSQTDFDGKTEFLGVRSVTLQPKELEVSVQPNPIENDLLNIQLSSPKEGEVSLEVISMDGKIILEKNVPLSEGVNTINFNSSSWSQGVYFLRTIQGGTIKTQKFVKSR